MPEKPSSRFFASQPHRIAAWWTRFRLSGGLGGLRRRGAVVDESIHGTARRPIRAVESAQALIAGDRRRSRLWRARPSQRIGRNLSILADLCWDGANHWRPWEDAAEPYDSVPLSYRRLANALLFVRSGLVMRAPFVALRESLPPWPYMLEPLPGSDRVTADAPVLDLNAARPRQIIEAPVLSLCHVYGYGYGHWLADAIPPLLDMLDLVAAGALRVLVPPLTPWQRRTLELLGVPSTAIVEINDATVACADLICHSFGGPEHALRPGKLLDAVYRRLRSAAPREYAGPRPRLIYVSRRSLGSWRELANEAEIEAALGSLGFAVMFPENMTLDQQIAAFSQAQVIVGPSGSAFANAGFAPQGCLIVSLVPEQLRHRWLYGLPLHLGHRLLVLVAERLNGDRAHVAATSAEFFKPFRYHIAAEIVTRQTIAAMTRLGVQVDTAAGDMSRGS